MQNGKQNATESVSNCHHMTSLHFMINLAVFIKITIFIFKITAILHFSKQVPVIYITHLNTAKLTKFLYKNVLN